MGSLKRILQRERSCEHLTCTTVLFIFWLRLKKIARGPIESIPNRKINKKPYVRAYHRFYVPVRMNQHLATIRIVAEERQGVITLDPTDVNLYDLIVEDKKRRANAPAGSLPLGGPDSSSDTVSIREMLAGVKDADGNT